MQKLFNVMSVASFVMSASMIDGTVTILFANCHPDQALQGAKLESVTGNVTDMVPGQIDEACQSFRPLLVQLCQSSHHFSVGGWIVVMSFRPEAFSLDFCHIKFWRGCLRFLLKRRKPFA